MADMAHLWVDGEISRLSKQISREYAVGKGRMAAKLNELLEDFDTENRRWKERVAQGTATQREYEEWLDGYAYDIELMRSVSREIAKEATSTNRIAMAVISAAMLGICSESASMAEYMVESKAGYGSMPAIEVLRDKLPKVGTDGHKDFAWNMRKVMAVVTSAVIAGSGLPEIRGRVSSIYDMNMRVANRALVTAATGAESMGKLAAYRAELASGIPIEKVWVAVMDNRTRKTHRELDGQSVPLDRPFLIESTGERIWYPADPDASPQERYNCRCSLEFRVVGQPEDSGRLRSLPDGLSYEDWKTGGWKE